MVSRLILNLRGAAGCDAEDENWQRFGGSLFLGTFCETRPEMHRLA